MTAQAEDQDIERREHYAAFVEPTERKLRLALTGAWGPDVARDATAEALLYGWQHWDRLRSMENPAGYLYRVAQTAARRLVGRRPVELPPVPVTELPMVEPGLPKALEALSDRQRLCVWLLHGLGWTAPEAADLTGMTVTTIRTHARRGMAKLRTELGVHP